MNRSATYDPNYSFVWTESGSVAESGGTESIDGGDGGPGNGTLPSGAMPSGTAVPSSLS